MRTGPPLGAVESVKEIADLIGKLHDTALNRRILELAEEVAALTREKRRADHRVEELAWASKFKSDL